MKYNRSQQEQKPPRYDTFAAYYDRVMSPLERWLFARLRSKIFASLPQDANLLEVGAGTGANFSFYPGTTQATASELSFKMIEKARNKETSKRVRIVQSCAEQLPFADDSFDAAVATLVFCSVNSPNEAFAPPP